MKLAPKTHHQLETFFRQYFEEENLRLPQVKIYARRGAAIVTKLLKVDGITLGSRVFIDFRLIKCDEQKRLCLSKNLLSHEIAHVVQYQKSGLWGFLFRYLKDYFVILRTKKKWNSRARLESYWEIPHEIEARDAAKKFVEWLAEQKK